MHSRPVTRRSRCTRIFGCRCLFGEEVKPVIYLFKQAMNGDHTFILRTWLLSELSPQPMDAILQLHSLCGLAFDLSFESPRSVLPHLLCTVRQCGRSGCQAGAARSSCSSHCFASV